jgi:predicted DNA-binding transcriptional regulator AlpA
MNRQFCGAEEIAAVFGRSRSWLYSRLPRLLESGFPHKDPLVGLWSLEAVQAWFKKRAGVYASGSTSNANPWD